MIDWVDIAFNTLWITGLAVVLAAFSYHDWLAHTTVRPLPEVLSRPSWKRYFSGGMLLASVGLAGGVADRTWEKAAWVVLAIAFAYQLMTVFREAGQKDGS